jgi:hypothetical protein
MGVIDVYMMTKIEVINNITVGVMNKLQLKNKKESEKISLTSTRQ